MLRFALGGVLLLALTSPSGCRASSQSGNPEAAAGAPPDSPSETSPPIAPTPGVAVTTHPRLLIREGDLPRLRSWATSSNPLFDKGLKPLVDEGIKAFPTIAKDDPGDPGYAEKPCEAYAMLFAFMSLISPNKAERDAHAKRARTLLMHAINNAAKGPQDEKPFRDPKFAIGDRSRWSGADFALTVDWIYGSLTAEDKKTIRKVFLRWAEDLQHAKTTDYNHPEPVGLVNDPKLLSDRRALRWSGNNYFNAHSRNLALMSLSFDAADDPGEELRKYLTYVTGAWLFMTDTLLKTDMRGGMPPEGFEYSPQALGYIATTLLALYTSGRADPNVSGKQVTFYSPFWNDLIPGYLHSLSPTPKTSSDESYNFLGPLYSVAWYGDGQKFFAPDFMGVFGPVGVYDSYTGNAKRLQHLRWIETNMPPGGAEKLETRAGDTNDLLDDVFYFLLFDPKAKPGPDPRPSYPLSHFSPGLGRYMQRTSWKENASWFTYKLSWETMDHQSGDGNMFELWRKGEWLTKERTGYGDDVMCTDYKNSVAIENVPTPKDHDHDFLRIQTKRGAQRVYDNDGDGKILAARFGADFTYFLGDATLLYNATAEKSSDVAHASRSIVWLVPDRIITYDRVVSKSANKFKRYWIQLPAQGTVADGLMSMKSPGGQMLYVRTLLPEKFQQSVEKVESLDDDRGKQPADLDPIKFRLKVEATGAPKNVRFLHVVQGADKKQPADPATLITSTGGTPFQGVFVNDTAVLFPVDIGHVGQVSYSAPGSTKVHLVTGLKANGSYKVTNTKSGDSVQISIKEGGDQKADAAGVLAIGKL